MKKVKIKLEKEKEEVELLTEEIREKVFPLPYDGKKIYGKKYLKVVVCDSSVRTFAYDDESVTVEVDKEGKLSVQDDRQWININSLKALELLKEGLDIAISKQKEILKESKNDNEN